MQKGILNKILFKEFMKATNITQYDPTNINTFRQICFKFNYFMKHIPFEYSIRLNSLYEAVIVEFRILPHIEFIIRNAIHKLGQAWSFTVICGNINYTFLKDICTRISTNIKLIHLDYDNMIQQEYSNFLMTTQFWDLLYGEKILIYQEDSLIFKNNIQDFIQYDFIGAPFLKESSDTPNCVGNGGLSLRTKTKMIEVINNCPIDKLTIGSSTYEYMKLRSLTTPPEDVYFSKNLQDFKIGDVADWETAHKFSSESIFNPDSFACHRIWNCTEKWYNHIVTQFKYKLYTPQNNIRDYLRFVKICDSFDNTHQIQNAFDIDIRFFCTVNNIEYTNKYGALSTLANIGIRGLIYHPKQITNLFPNVTFYTFLNNIYIFYKKEILTIQHFTNKYIYDTTFEYFYDLSVNKKYENLNDTFELIILVFIGNIEKGFELINQLINYKKIQADFNISVCFNSNLIVFSDFLLIKNFIKNNFEFYAIYYCNEYGTDITPTLLMYYDIIKTHKFKHIIKLHTKCKQTYHNLVECVLSVPLNDLIANKQYNCNCIGAIYNDLKTDAFNRKLVREHLSSIHTHYSFVAGTIFYTTDTVFNKVLDFLKQNNFKAYLLNNLYENNSINKTYSPVHFLERLFGVIKI